MNRFSSTHIVFLSKAILLTVQILIAYRIAENSLSSHLNFTTLTRMNIKKYTELSSLGEFGLIDRLTKDIKIRNKSTLKGVGDDAAVLDYGKKKILISTDMLIQGIHFDLVYTPLKHLGYKAVASNVSDICAMNGVAKQITVSIAVSNHFSVEGMDELYAGIHLACQHYGVDLVGGDTTSSLSGLCISITVLGEADEKDIVYRNTAKENQLICVTGNLGAAYMGLQLLEREKKVFGDQQEELQPDFSGFEYILERQLKPEARMDIVKLLKEKHILPTAMIDVSDGLASEIMHICKSSGVGCNVYEEKIPIDYQTYKMAEELNMNATVCALSGGEDYELLFTVPLDLHDTLVTMEEISIIGHTCNVSEGHMLTTRDGNSFELKAQGWINF
jgi:thiamine-monophosphate kinase